jgi:hypothetical protein
MNYYTDVQILYRVSARPIKTKYSTILELHPYVESMQANNFHYTLAIRSNVGLDFL